MNYIFAFLILFSFITAIFTGKMEEVVSSLLKSTEFALKVCFFLIGIMCFWLGIVKIAQESGLIDFFSKLISPILRIIFPDLKNNSKAYSNIALNVVSNALGLQNAATPFGIKAMSEMQKDSKTKDTATNSMCLFLAMNTAGFQIVPASVLAILAASGADNPSQIILPTFIVTSLTFIFAIVIAKVFACFWKDV